MDYLLIAKKILAKHLQVPVEQIKDNDTIEQINQLDSVIFAAIVMDVERLLKKEIDVRQWLSLSSVQDLANIIKNNHQQ
ncbi:acyl carrier protein [Neisseria sp. Ec49-e6-T10]|uniref:acyl carrier protein n=1 Tax=Neisseria sp. Ec49-e6-T10 TaxID=3140744 RepID=UPI003EBE4FF9